ncbi:hypothetical protein BDV93DRAFT_567206 [Ceratobasidium sp. AG-I]|nr:hypothetical protein BDV93DRAFT_567206 [Ceratobasidium sp. AG-I]
MHHGSCVLSSAAYLRRSEMHETGVHAEAALTLNPPEPPEQDEAMLRLATPGTVATRLAFPVTPMLTDVGVLREELLFGDDLAVDSFRSRRLSRVKQELGKKAIPNEYALGVPSGRLVRPFWCTVLNILTKSGAHFVPSTCDGELQSDIILVLLAQVKSIFAECASVSLYLTTSTRGSKEVKPHVTKYLACPTANVPLGETSLFSTSASNGGLLPNGFATRCKTP